MVPDVCVIAGLSAADEPRAILTRRRTRAVPPPASRSRGRDPTARRIRIIRTAAAFSSCECRRVVGAPSGLLVRLDSILASKIPMRESSLVAHPDEHGTEVLVAYRPITFTLDQTATAMRAIVDPHLRTLGSRTRVGRSRVRDVPALDPH